jgi:hypothetical protein
LQGGIAGRLKPSVGHLQSVKFKRTWLFCYYCVGYTEPNLTKLKLHDKYNNKESFIKEIENNIVTYTSGINLKILPFTGLEVDAPLVCN